MAFIDRFEDSELIEEESDINSFRVLRYIDGENVFKLKLFETKDSVRNNVAKEIWLNETRQLNKLRSVTNAKKYLEIIHDSFIDDEGNYCLIYKSSESAINLNSFLSSIETPEDRIKLFSKTRKHWLNKNRISSISSRMLLWKNVLRLVDAIVILHSQDIIHRNISIKSVIYDDNEDIDDTERFTLGGFEKSLDFNKINTPIFTENTDKNIYTVQQDWVDLARLINDILCINDSIEDVRLSTKEIQALDYLVNGKSIDHTRLVDKTFLKGIIKGAIDDLSRVGNSSSPNFYLTLPKIDSNAFRYIEKVLKKHILENLTHDFDAENITSSDIVNIIRSDLSVKSFEIFSLGNTNVFILKGNNLLYKIKEYKDKSLDDWYISSIGEIYDTIPDSLNYKESVEVQGSLKVTSNTRKLMRDASFTEENSWKIKLIQFNKENRYKDFELECLQGLLLSFAIEVAFSETDKFRVSLERINDNELHSNEKFFIDSGCFYYRLEYKKEDNLTNNKLSEILNLKSPYLRFELHLQKSVEDWIVEPADKPKEEIERNERIAIQYAGKNGSSLIFSSKEPLERSINFIGKDVVLIYPESLKGQSAQNSRRIKIFYSLLDQGSLVSSLANPASSSNYTITSQNFDSESSLKLLDSSKQEVFKSLLKTQPYYYIEGPPGVGKTHLITTYVDYLFNNENSAKILLSAQSHATVGILYDEVMKKLSEQPFLDDLTIVSDFVKDKNKEHQPMGVSNSQRVTMPYAEKFKNSDMFRKYYSEDGIRDKLDRFLKNPDFQFFNSVLRAANLVFTTSNSGLMERLVTNDINFDVSIIEECGKSSGIELVSPMMVSTKRVLIGDYRQLPAFSEQHIQRIIQNPKKFDMHLILDQLQNVGFRKAIIYDLDLDSKSLYKQSNTVYLKNLDKYFSLFKNLCRSAESIRNRDQDSFGSLIDIQHRMHPEISRIISNTVYEGKLKDDKDKARHYKEVTPFEFKDSELRGLNKDNAVLWVNIPDKNSKLGIKQLENNNINKAEIDIVKEVITKIYSCNNKNYSITVLSPYKDQVNMINKKIEINKINSCFSGSLKGQDLAKTVDSFQGDQADVIVISLVRHNSHQPITSALGFLTDLRRMNVLLSRAKYKMIIIGCFGLFEKWQDLETKEQNNGRGYLSESDKDFLDSFVSMFKSDFELMKDNTLSIDDKNFKNANFIQANSFLGI